MTATRNPPHECGGGCQWHARHAEDPDRAFDEGVDWLREHRPTERLSPGLLGTEMFGPPVSVYDLFAPDRDERETRACGGDAAPVATP